MTPRPGLLAGALLLAAMPAIAQETAPPVAPPDDGAYTMMPAEGRHLKIDRRSGEVSICSEEQDTWRCRLVPDDRQAYVDAVEQLEAENETLRARVAELEAAAAAEDAGDHWIGPEDEKKLDEFLDFSDKALRRFFGMVQDLKRDLDQPDAL